MSQIAEKNTGIIKKFDNFIMDFLTSRAAYAIPGVLLLESLSSLTLFLQNAQYEAAKNFINLAFLTGGTGSSVAALIYLARAFEKKS